MSRISQFDINHIRSGLLIAKDAVKQVGTDGDMSRVNYALRLLALLEEPSFAPTGWWADQLEQYGTE